MLEPLVMLLSPSQQASIERAFSIASWSVKFLIVSSLLCVPSTCSPQTSRCLRASFRYPPNSQCVARRRSLAIQSASDSPGSCSLLWNLNHSATTAGLGSKCFSRTAITSVNDLSLGSVGASRFLKSPYVFPQLS